MSLILEALKKSEQQRRLGEAPTLGSPVVMTRRRRSVLPVLAALIVIAAGAGWWLTRKPAQPPAISAPPVTAEKGGPAMTKPAPSAKPGAPAAPGATMQERLRQEAFARKTEQSKHIETPGNAKPNPPLGLPSTANAPATAMPHKLGDPAPHATPPQDAATPGAPAGNPAAKLDATASAPKSAATTPPAPAAAPGSASASATPPAPAKTPAGATAAATPQGATLPTIWELPFSTRKDIPALDLSMHVYSSDPKQRFVVIKGDRHVEGDEVGQDLMLREIRQDGLVLEYKGQKFFFPRSGR